MEKQLTFAKRHHQLTNINVWTPDSQWLAFDVRPSPSSFTGRTIERVNVESGHCEVIYTAKQGAHVGVVTVSPDRVPRYVFIHGPENPDAHWHYDFHHRRGVIVSHETIETLDACAITPPFTTGALRGGSHVHVFSPDGSRLSFTYDDHVMFEHHPEKYLRNVAVAVPLCAVCPPKRHPREHDGSHFCVVVSETVPHPCPGSDEISRAYEEGWIGQHGYRKKAHHQRWALAFIGDTCNRYGEKIAEVFVVDLPDNLTDFARRGSRPLAGTADDLPAPPAGVQQRRLTFTKRGVAAQPRHWLRSSPDGSRIAFLMQDDNDIVQLWTVSPNGGEPQQITHSESGIQSAFSWHPLGNRVAFICDNSVCVCHINSGEIRRLTPRTTTAPAAEAVVFSPDGEQIAFMRDVEGFRQLFTVKAV